MLNHKTGCNNARLFIQNEKNHTIYEMKTIGHISKGSDVYNTYGDLGNSELLRKYGFVDGLDNPHNIITIPLKIVLEAIKLTKFTHFKQKMSFLKQNRLLSDEESFLLTNHHKQPPPKDLTTTATTDDDSEDDSEEDHDNDTGFDPLLIFLLKILHMTPKEWNQWKTKTTQNLQKKRKEKE